MMNVLWSVYALSNLLFFKLQYIFPGIRYRLNMVNDEDSLSKAVLALISIS